MKNPHIGSDFDEYLEQTGTLEETRAVAAKRVLAYQIAREMEDRSISKSDMARRMNTSRSSLDRLLDPSFPSVTLLTLERAARALGLRLHIELT